MDKDCVKLFAGLIGTKIEAVSPQGWAACRCPLAKWTHDSGKDSTASAAILVAPGAASRFYCFTCESHDLLSLLTRLKMLGALAPKVKIAEALKLVLAEDEGDTMLAIKEFDEPLYSEHDDGNNDALFPEDWLASFVSAMKVPEALTYLHQRGLDLYTVHDLDLRYDVKRHAVCFPIREQYGRLAGMRGRRIAPTADQPPYHMYKTKDGPEGHYNRNVWLGENAVDWDKPLVMVESVFDYAAVVPIYSNVVAPLTVGMGPRKVKRMSAALDIVTLFDLGKGGDKARALIDQHLSTNRRTHLLPCGRDRLDKAKKASDPGEMLPVQLMALLEEHVPLGP